MDGNDTRLEGRDTTASGRHPDPPPTGAAPANISAVNLKLPPFWPADPELWFIRVEALFSCRRITSQRSKFDHVVSSLAPEYAAEVRDLLLRPPADNPYTTLREQLIKRTALSEQRRLQQLLTGEELGDRKPTQLRRMQQLLGDRTGLDTSFLRELFMQRLPNNVRIVLASTPEDTALDKLAEMADKIMEVAAPSHSVAALTTPTVSATPTIPPPPALAADLEGLCFELSRLEKLIHKLSLSLPFLVPFTSLTSPLTILNPAPAPTQRLVWQLALLVPPEAWGSCTQVKSPCSHASNSNATH